jgi:hypothetical protein
MMPRDRHTVLDSKDSLDTLPYRAKIFVSFLFPKIKIAAITFIKVQSPLLPKKKKRKTNP